MKTDSRFPKLPSLSDLLGHPTVAQVVKRVNQTNIAQRATGFLEELQSNLRHRWDQGQIPSLGQLAERFARRLLGPAETSISAVNATGTLLGRWPALPLAEPTIDEMVRVASEYHSGDEALRDRVQHELRELNTAEAVFVANSYPAAVELVRSIPGNIELSPFSGFRNPQLHDFASIPTIAERLQGGADLVVVDGAGLIGGPSCGIILGKREKLQAVLDNPLSRLTIPATLTLAGLAATLAIYQTADKVIHQIPIWQLLSTPMENLEQRCHRLAVLIGANEAIDSATPTQCDSAWCDSQELTLVAPSWAVVVKPQAGAFDSCANLLLESNPRILARVQQEEIWLDLRGVFPRWDQHLVATTELTSP